jgi:glutaredoxin
MKKPLFALAALAAALAATPPAWALYKVVGPDGRVTYTDRAPPAGAGRVQQVRTDGSASASVALPPGLRETAQRFPVTLYTSADCGDICEQGRRLLRERGVPYQERLATTDDEREAWPRLVGGTDAPVLMVGQQRLRSFAPQAWNDTLDLAGYPLRSLLPAAYEAPPVRPLLPRPERSERERAVAEPSLPVLPNADPERFRF